MAKNTHPQSPEYNIWHPFTQMQTAPAPLNVVRGEGSYLFLEDGRKVLDGISSWWVNVHGHAHPHIAEAIGKQAQVLEQVIFAGFTHPEATRLARRIADALPGSLEKVFFSDDGSTAVEVGLKMAWQHWHNLGEERRTIFAFEGAYHGDTFGAMSVSARSVFTKAFDPLLFDVVSLPSPADISWEDLKQQMASAQKSAKPAALILEPLIQGAGGMKMYAPEMLEAIVSWCQANNILVIFDEVMTGFWRTGRLFAAEHITSVPDIVCLSKGLTGGFLPLSLTVAKPEIYASFLSDDRSRALFHGHSFTANPIGCAAANASLDISLDPETEAKVRQIVQAYSAFVPRLKSLSNVTNIRSQGTILAFDLVVEGPDGYLNNSGQEVCAAMFEAGYFLRPLGNVIYLMPPYCTPMADLRALLEKLLQTVSDLG